MTVFQLFFMKKEDCNSIPTVCRLIGKVYSVSTSLWVIGQTFLPPPSLHQAIDWALKVLGEIKHLLVKMTG